MRCCASHAPPDPLRRPTRAWPRRASTPSRTATAPSAPAPARAALRHTTFRRVFIGAFLSNIGSWMQNVILGAMAYDLTHSPTFVGVLLFAQLGPLLLFSLVGGLLADLIDRRRLLISVSVAAGPAVARPGVGRPGRRPVEGRRWSAIVFLIGMGQAVFGPTYSALLPALVGKEDLPGAISLNSAQMNGSRVLGPVIASAFYARTGASVVFLVNAASLPPGDLGAAQRASCPRRWWTRADRPGSAAWRPASRPPSRTAWSAGRSSIVFAFSLLSLPFIGQMPTLADRNLGIAARSQEYGYLYAVLRAGRPDRRAVDRHRALRAEPGSA